MQALLPDKYYLTHARELFEFVRCVCPHLLESAHQNYIDNFELLSPDAQCLLIRLISRKPRFLNKSSLLYAEIEDVAAATAQLLEFGYASEVQPPDWAEFITVLTKPQLAVFLQNHVLGIKASTNKAQLLELAKACQPPDQPALIAPTMDFLVRRQQITIDYILFLFFGDLSNRFQKFAMRDLGVLKTKNSKKRNTKDTQSARFSNIEEAQSAFQMQLSHKQLVNGTLIADEELTDSLLSTTAIGPAAQQIKDKILLKVAGDCAQDNPAIAISLWQACREPIATERWIRARYKHGNREQLKSELEAIQSQEMPPETTIFVEDFYARKYQGKRTSIYTDLLREPTRKLHIDETYIGEVEQGVIQLYKREHMHAYFSENRHWRVMFALTFWDLLFDQDKTQHYSMRLSFVRLLVVAFGKSFL